MPCCIILSTISAVRVLYFLCVRVVSVVLYFTLHHALPKSTARLPPSSFSASENPTLCILDEVELNFESYPRLKNEAKAEEHKPVVPLMTT